MNRANLYVLFVLTFILILSYKANAQCPLISGALNQGYVPGGGGHPFYEPGLGNMDEFGVVDDEEFYVKVGSYPPIKAFRKTDACGTYFYSSYDTDNDRFPLDFDMTENQQVVVKTYRIFYDELLIFQYYIPGISVNVTPPSASEVGFPQDFLMNFDGTLHQVAWNLVEHPWENYVSTPQYYIPQQDLTVDIIGPDELPYNESKEFIADINGGAGLYNIKWSVRDYPNGTFTEVKSTPQYPENWESNYYKLYNPPGIFYFYDDEYRYNLTMQGYDVELKVVVNDYQTNDFSAEASIVITSVPAITFLNNIEESEDYGYLMLKNNNNGTTYQIASGNPFDLNFNTNYTIRTNELPFLVDWNNTGKTEKHHQWSVGTEPPAYELNHNFTFQLSTVHTMKAVFKATEPATVRNLLEGCNVSGGKIKFRDPWRYYESDGEWHQSNQLIEYDSPLELLNNSPESYGGILLDQEIATGNHYYSVETFDQDILMGGKYGDRHYYFQKWDGDGIEFQNPNGYGSGIVFTTEYAYANAIMKGHLLSSEALGTNGQRHLVRDSDGYYHLFYISMDKLWYTSSLTTSMTGNWDDESSLFDQNAKSVSVDIDGDLINIVFEGKSGSDYKIYRSSLNADNGNTENPVALADISSSYYGSAYPVVAASSNERFFVYRKSSTGGLYYIRQYIDDILHTEAETSVPNTGFTSLKPAVCMDRQGYNYDVCHLVYQDGNLGTAIKYTYWGNGSFRGLTTISGSSGYSINTCPSVSPVKKDKGGGQFRYDPIVSWLGESGGGTLGKTNGESIPAPRLIVRVCNDWTQNSWGSTNVYGEEVNSTQNGSVSGAFNQSVITWGQKDGTESLWVRRDGVAYSGPYCLEPEGYSTNISNGTSLSTIKALSFDNAELPYIINPSGTGFAGTPDCGAEEKVVTTYPFTFSRAGVILKKGVEFAYHTGDVVADDSAIQFIEVPDTLTYSSSIELNQVLKTKDFPLNANSSVEFSNYYYVLNKEIADSLSEGDAVSYRVELVNSASGNVAGTFDNITYNKQNLDDYENVSYQIDCSGITEGNYFFRLVTSVTGDAEYCLINAVNDAGTVAKRSMNNVLFTGDKIPETYDLSQNYPNPFNPSTTINYQLPQTGFVTLKIYDILGKEVVTLVNEQKTRGRYSVNYDASRLASGVYIYQIRVNDYVGSKKMILVK